MFKEATTSSLKENNSGVDDVSPYIMRAMRNCKILEVLMALSSSIQVLIDEHTKNNHNF